MYDGHDAAPIREECPKYREELFVVSQNGRIFRITYV
jgi:hypothetical protein